MVPRIHIVPVKVERVDTETGLWCTVCALSTGIRVWYVSTIGSCPMLLKQAVTCSECDGDQVEG